MAVDGLIPDGREQEDDTIIGVGSVRPHPGVTDSFESDAAEAQTIIVSRAPRHSDEMVIGSAEPDPEPEPVARFALRIGVHPLIPLEVPAYIGRRPSTPRITGPRMPRLVMVPSPSREVSSTHVEILQDAHTVVVKDMGSTNGTTVKIPGSTARMLRQGESLVVGAETIVDIGDGIHIVIVSVPQDATPVNVIAKTEGNQ